MRRSLLGYMIFLGSLMLASAGFAEPPHHAPAHGYRGKKHVFHSHKQLHSERKKSDGFQIVFDSERGVSVVVDLPGVYVQAGRFYRHHDGRWQMSSRADGDWKFIKAAVAPESIRNAHRHGVPANAK